MDKKDEDRFIAQTYFCPVSGCWIWMGAINSLGRGNFKIGKKQHRPYKLMWEEKNGPVPKGLVLDHYKCDNPLCCNPDHVRPVSHRENILRGNGLASSNAAKTNCPKCGGEYSSWPYGRRYCKRCRNEQELLRKGGNK